MAYNYSLHDNEIFHYGVVGMKWGVSRALSKSKANPKLYKKALTYDKQSAKLTKKSEKLHSKYDLEYSNRNAKKAAVYDARAATVEKKAIKSDSSMKQLMLKSKSENLKYKATKARIKANRLSKTAGYGSKAMAYSIKSDKVAAKAAKARHKIAGNEYYIAVMKKKVSQISEADIQNGYSFVNELLAS